MFKKLFYTLLGASTMIAGTAFAVNVSVPASTGYGQILIGNAVGGSYSTVATSSIKFFTLTTSGTSGAATYSGGTLNIPQYAGSGASSTLLGDTNTFSGIDKFTNAPIFSSLTGLLKGNGSSALTVAANGTDFTLITAKTCNGNDFVSAVTAAGVFTCTTPSAGTAASSTLLGDSNTFSGVLNQFSNTIKVASLSGFIGGNGGTLYNFATSTIKTSQLTNDANFLTSAVTAVNGTANQITSSGGATPTLSLPNHVIFPTDYVASAGSTTNATTTNFAIVGAAANCNGTSALTTNSTGVVGCTAQPQGTVTAVSVASANGFAGSSSGGATPSLTLSTTITGLLKGNGTAITAATPGSDYDTFAYPFPAGATTTLVTFTNSSTTLGSFTYASSTQYFGANLASCNGDSNALTWSGGLFGCNTISGSGGTGVGTVSTSTQETANQVAVFSSTNGYPATLAGNSTFTFNGGTFVAGTVKVTATGANPSIISTNGTLLVQADHNHAGGGSGSRLTVEGGPATSLSDQNGGDVYITQGPLDGAGADGRIYFTQSNNANRVGFDLSALSGVQTITVPNLSGTLCLTSTCIGTTSTWGLGNNGLYEAGPTGIPFVAASSSLNLPNTALSNSAITINGSSVSLGGSITVSSTTLLANSNTFTGLNKFSNSSTTLGSFSYASSTQYFGANLSSCNGGSNALTWSAGVFGCNTITAGSAASSTLLSDTNTFSGTDRFAHASSTLFSAGPLFFDNFGEIQNTNDDYVSIDTFGLRLVDTLSGSGTYTIFDTSGISGANKTFTFPNETGTFALGTGSAGNCAQWSTTNTLTTTGSPCGAGGGGGAPPFTPTAWGASTTTVLGFTNGFISNATSTITYLGTGGTATNNGRLYNAATTTAGTGLTYNGTSFNVGGLTTTQFTSANVSQWTNDAGYLTGANTIATTSGLSVSQLSYYTKVGGITTLGGVSTSTLTASGPLTGSFTQVGSGGSIGCTTASAGVAGCLNSSDWSTFNNKQATMTATWPITISGGGPIIQWSGLASTSGISAQQILYATGVNSYASAATSSLSGGGPITVSNSPFIIGGSTATLGCTSASSGVTGCLTGTDWNTFNGKENVLTFNNPNIRTGNTINWVGLATTSQPSSSNLLVSNGLAGVYGVATTSETCSGVVNCTAHTVLTGGGAITITGGTPGQVLGWLSGVPTWTASSSVAAGTGISISASGAVTTVTNTGVISNSCSSGITCSGTNPSSFSIGGNALTLAMFPTIAANTVIGNLTGGTATPTAFATSSLFTGSTGQAAWFSASGGLTGTSSLSFTAASSTFLSDVLFKKTSPSAFTIQDGFGTNVFNINTASTTGSIFSIIATTSPFSGAGVVKLFDIDQYGHQLASSTMTPILSSCGSGPTLTSGSNDTYGSFTVGSAATGCTVTYGSVRTNTPVQCSVTARTGSVTNTLSYTCSTTAITMTETAASGVYDYEVQGQ